jgi:hypothetical protein
MAFFPAIHIVHYIRSVGVVNVITGVFCLITSVVWCSVNNYWWGSDSKVRAQATRPCSTDKNASTWYSFSGVLS